jgi:RNA polymerase sigma-70 factor, ECF subfamily
MRAAEDHRSPPDSFDEFYRTNFHPITLQMYAYTGDLGDAQDLAQEAFCRAYARWDRLQSYDDPVAWVRRVAWNLGASRWRRLRVVNAFLRRQREQHAPGPGPDRVALVRALATLPARQRRLFVLHHLADLSIAEIAVQESVPEGTVKSALHRARAVLARHLGEQRKETHNV